MTSAEPAARERVVPLLRCPNCGDGMSSSGSGVACASGHGFDRARQGHLTLLGGRGRRFAGDSTDQVGARERVLASGLFDPVAEALVSAATEALGGVDAPVVLDAGAGTGFYLGHVLGSLASASAGPPSPLGIGTEISAPAARRLARAHPLAAALVADTWDGLPLAAGCVDLVQVVFAPRNPAEFARVLRPGGALVVAVPGPGHLEPLRSEAGMLTPTEDKAARLGERFAESFESGRFREVDLTSAVPAGLASDIVLMGPSGVHLDRDGLTRRLGADDREVRVHVEVHSFARRQRPLGPLGPLRA